MAREGHVRTQTQLRGVARKGNASRCARISVSSACVSTSRLLKVEDHAGRAYVHGSGVFGDGEGFAFQEDVVVFADMGGQTSAAQFNAHTQISTRGGGEDFALRGFDRTVLCRLSTQHPPTSPSLGRVLVRQCEHIDILETTVQFEQQLEQRGGGGWNGITTRGRH
ncbi:hypothetical protein EYF80_023684 [Liparis tanakae]|uniref:Uncharacterized protein n=1 Tax=Liparis tanakae TaxID=230148 RepID=A0A4Z2HJW4_9TELE|nr:hypothetical protein EYF80_023684 [Liparis tanakae]